MYPEVALFGITIPSYTLCVSMGVLASTFLLMKLLLKRNLLRKYIPLIFLSLIGLLFGARLFGIISTLLDKFVKAGRILLFDSVLNSGIVYWGGLIGFLLTLSFLCDRKNLDIEAISQELVVFISLFHAFGRIGCYFAGCCYGCEYSGFLALPYRLGFDNPFILRFPTQLLEAFFEFAIFTIAYLLYQKKYAVTLKTYLFSYSVFRFLIEFYRGDEVRGVYGVISFSQIVCILVLMHLVLQRLIKRRRKSYA